jgi:chromosome segregation ATPase
MPDIRSRIRDVEIPFSTLVRGHLKTLDTQLLHMKPTYNDLVELLATRDQELAALRQELKESRNREAALCQELEESRKREAALCQEVAALRQELTALKEELKESRNREAALCQELEESRKREAARDQEIVALKQELTALEKELTAFKEEFKAMVESTDDLIKKANARYFQDSWHDIVNALNIMHANLTLLPPPPTCSGHALM